MTRAAFNRPWSGIVARLRALRTPTLPALPTTLRPVAADLRLRIGLAQLAAVAAAVVILALEDRERMAAGDALIWLVIGLGLAGLRTATVGRNLAVSTLVLDAVGTVVFLSGTGAPTSPFYALALAGAWWGAHVPRPRSGLIYAVAFVVSYSALVMPAAVARLALVEAFEDLLALVVIALLADWFVRVDRRAIDLSDALGRSGLQGQSLAIREGLQRILGTIDMPVDVVLAAAQVGLTVTQSEMLAYLVLGLTNREIAEASSVSEATVRYRLTGLYRTLGVHGRRAAVRRALELGLSLPTEPEAKRPSSSPRCARAPRKTAP